MKWNFVSCIGTSASKMQDFKLSDLRALLTTFAEALSGVHHFLGPSEMVDLVIDWKAPGTGISEK